MQFTPDQVRAKVATLTSGGNTRDALKLLYQSIKQQPEEASLWISLGDTCKTIGNRQKAIEAYSRAAAHFANSGALIQAISANKLIIELDPEHQETQSQLATLFGAAKAKPAAPSPQFDAVDLDLDEVLAAPLDDAEMINDHDSAVAANNENTVMAAPLEDAERVVPESDEATSDEIITLTDETTSDGLVILDDEATDIIDAADLIVDEALTSGGGWGDPNADSHEILMELPSVPIFSDLPSESFADVIDQIQRTRYFPDEVIIEEGTTGDAFYVIAGGEAKVTKRDNAGAPIELARLQTGTFFGEIAFLTGSTRTASVIAADHCDVLEFKKQALETLIEQNSKIRDVLETFYRKRLVDGSIKTSKLLQTIPAQKRDAILRHFETLTLNDAATVLNKGDIANALYIVVMGSIEAGDKRFDNGGVFGAAGLLRQEQATEDHIARGETRILKVNSETFGKLYTGLKAFANVAQALTD